MTTIFKGMVDNIGSLSSRLLKGEIGIFPCDTIYGICAIPSPESRERILEIKERPANKNFITLMSLERVKQSPFVAVPELLYAIWPAPLTAIMMDADGQTHAVRVPKDEPLQQILASVGALYSSSVNISGQPSLSRFEDIEAQFSGKVDFIVEEKTADHALPSTIIDVTKKPFVVLREGAFPISELTL